MGAHATSFHQGDLWVTEPKRFFHELDTAVWYTCLW